MKTLNKIILLIILGSLQFGTAATVRISGAKYLRHNETYNYDVTVTPDEVDKEKKRGRIDKKHFDWSFLGNAFSKIIQADPTNARATIKSSEEEPRGNSQDWPKGNVVCTVRLEWTTPRHQTEASASPFEVQVIPQQTINN